MSATSPAASPAVRNGRSVHVHPRIEDIDPSEWNALCPRGDILGSHRFVRLCQGSGVEDARYRHLVLERGGRLSAVATLCSIRVSLEVLSSGRMQAAIRRVRGWDPSFLKLPIVMCGLPVSFGSSCVRIREGEDPAPIADLIASAAEAFAAEAGAGLVVFKEFDRDEMLAFDGLRARGYFRAPSLPYCTLPVRAPSFEDYLASLRSGYRRQVRSGLDSASAAGLSIREIRDFAGECGTLFALYEQIMARAEHRLEHLNMPFFQGLGEFGSSSRALLVEREGHVIASAILLDDLPATIFLLAGIDYAHSRECGAYPYLVTEIVADAHRRGARTLGLGQTSYGLKGRLGAEAQPRWLYLKHTGRLPHAALRLLSGLLFPTFEIPHRRVFHHD